VPLPADAPLPDLAVRALFESRIVIVAHRSHPLSRARHLAELTEAAWVLTGPPGSFGDPERLPFPRLGLTTPTVAVECPSYSTLLSLLPDSPLIGVLPQTFFERHALHYELVSLPLEEALPSVSVHSIVRADALLTPPAQRLLEAFMQEAGEMS
jgi:DNA-binding transcriptional LysR family regulator